MFSFNFQKTLQMKDFQYQSNLYSTISEIYRNFHQQIQAQYTRNLDFLKSKYKTMINPDFSMEKCSRVSQK